MTLEEFERDLAKLIGRPTDLRPFVCEGSPLDCEIFLVGFNPATELATDFWSFWRTGYGFDKREWLKAYAQTRLTPKPGKTRRLKTSPTRLRMQAFVEAAAPVKVLETNIFSADSADMRSLDRSRREIAPLHFLLEAIRPKVVVAHGDKAIEAMRPIRGPWALKEAGHFSRFESKASAAVHGQLARDIVLGKRSA
jgi:hypothetical protein